MEALARALAIQVRQLGVDRAIFVGHSAGAALALATASHSPELVAGLLLADAPGDLRMLPEDETNAFLVGMRSSNYPKLVSHYWASILSGARATTAKIVMNDLRRTPQATVVNVLTAVSEFDPITALKAFAGPVLLVTSPLNEAPNSLQKLLPHLPRQSVHSVSHWLQMDAPGTFNTILHGFVERDCARCR